MYFKYILKGFIFNDKQNEAVMQLTRFTDYGLRTLMYLAARPQERHSVKEIADHYGISRNHLVKVVHRLSQLAYISTTKGKGGGIRLVPETEKLGLGEIMMQLETDMNIAECFNPQTNTCLITEDCQLKHYLFDARQAFIAAMNQHTLSDTVSGKTASIADEHLQTIVIKE